MFYVYELRDPLTGVPFYIGKGQGDRAYQHQREVVNGTARGNAAKITKIKAILAVGRQVEVAIVAEYAFEEDALDHEFHAIDADPTLTNIAPGGVSPGKVSELYLAKSRYERLKKLCIQLDKIRASRVQKATGSLINRAIQRATEGQKVSDQDKVEIDKWLASNPMLEYKKVSRHSKEYGFRPKFRAEGPAKQRHRELCARLRTAQKLRDEAESHLISLRKSNQRKRAETV